MVRPPGGASPGGRTAPIGGFMPVTHVFAAPLGFRPLELDLFMPPGDGPHPLVVWIHGGGWREGHRRHLSEVLSAIDPFTALPAAGFAVAAVDYRLSGEAIFPAQLTDVRAAIGWLRRQAARLRLDPGRIALWGESAGGHLAALAGLSEPGIAGVVDWCGPSDLATMGGRHDEPGSAESTLLGGPVPEVPERARAANPCLLAHADAPPFLIMHGTEDPVVPVGQSRLLAGALRRVTLHEVAGAGHCFDGVEDGASLMAPVLRFLSDRVPPLA
jgi:acetyl esterase/lipase